MTRFAGVARRFEPEAGVEIQAEVAEARNYLAYVLGEGSPDQKAEAISVYDEVIARYGGGEDRRLRKHVANAMFNRASNLWDLGRSDEAAAGFRQFVDTYSDDAVGKSYLLPRAEVELGSCLVDLGQIAQALDTFDAVVERYGVDSSPKARTWVAAALERKAYTLHEAKRSAEAIGVCDQLVSRFASDLSDPIQLRVLVVLCWKARWLELLGEQPQAVSAFHEIVDRFPGQQPPEREPSVAWARKRLAAITT
jgi:tetratricopeptide (TPR) repeat protein